MEKILHYYGFASVEEAGKEFGFGNKVDAERFLKEMYEDDTAPEQ